MNDDPKEAPEEMAEESLQQMLRKTPAGGSVEVVTTDDFERRSKELPPEGEQEASDFEASAGAVSAPRPTTFSTGGAEGQVASDDGPAVQEVAPRRTSSQAKADLQMRSLGRAIDVVIFAIIAQSITYLGPLVALTYLLLADGLFDGASLGKKIVKLKVVRLNDLKPARLFDSLLRNAPLGVAGLFVLVPIVGWALFLTLGLAVILFESYMVWKDPCGIRAGDILAGTQVVSTKALPLTDGRDADA